MQMPRIGWIILIAAFLTPLGGRAQNQTLVFDGGTLIDGTGRSPISNAVVVVEGNRIKAVGTRGQVTYPQNARVIKTDGRFILPGLVDGHIHLIPSFMPQMFLHYGVTTIGDTNNQTDWILLQRQELNSGKIKGPRLFVSGTALGGPTAVTNTQEYIVVKSLRNPEETRAYVRQLVAMGVDFVKTDYSLTLDEVAAAVDEAKKVGVPVVGHSQNIRRASEVGLKYMEHTNTLGWAILEEMGPDKVLEGGANPEHLMDMSLMPPLVKLLVQRGVYINATQVARFRTASTRGQEWAKAAEEILKDPALAAMVPADTQRAWAQLGATGRNPDVEGYRKVQEFLREVADAGGKIIAGSDETGGTIPGLSLHNEMQMITDAGVAPMKAIQSATLWSAESIGQDKNLGSIEPGKLADFAIIEGNPLSDISVTRNVRMVIKDGQVLDTSYDPRSVTEVPRPFGTLPQLSAINPPVAQRGAANVTLQVAGERFNPKSVVRFDNTDLKTEFVSSTKLTATIDSRLLQNSGSYSVYVLNPGAGGSVSNATYLFVVSK